MCFERDFYSYLVIDNIYVDITWGTIFFSMLVFVCLSAIVFYCKSFDNIIRVVKVGQQQVKRQSINFLTFYDYQDFYHKKICMQEAVGVW